MRVEIKRALSLDIHDIVSRSPVSDVPDAETMLKGFLRQSSQAWTGLIDGQVVCVWGVITPTILSDRAYLWLLSTDAVDAHPFTFVRHSQMIIKELSKSFKYIEGHVIIDAERSIRWLKWLGFEMTGEMNGKWMRFEMRAA